MTTDTGWSIWVLEYSHVLEYPEGGIIYGQHNQGTRVMPYGYVYLRGHGHHVMIDVGYDDTAYNKELADRFGVSAWQPPTRVLAEVGATPEDIDTVVVTHAHFDHFGNTRAFPNATFYVQERELTSWVWAMSLPASHHAVMAGIDPDDVLRGVELAKDGRLRLVDGDVADVLPGVNLWAAHDTHTFGHMFVDVQAEEGPENRYVLAGDNVYAYENVRGVDHDGMIRAVGLSIDTLKGIRTIAQMIEMVPEIRQIIPVHEGRLPENFPSRRTDYDLHVTEVHRTASQTSYVT